MTVIDKKQYSLAPKQKVYSLAPQKADDNR